MPVQLGLPDGVILIVSVLAAFLGTVTLVLGLSAPVAETPAMRLVRYAGYTGRRGSPGVDVEVLTLRERLLSPSLSRLIEFAARAAPGRAKRTVAAELIMAGSPMNPNMFLAIRSVVMFGAPAAAVGYVLSRSSPGPVDLAVLAMSLIWGQRMPSMWLKRRIRARQRAIDRRLPYALDLMVACLEGGLSLDAALVKVVEQSEGPLTLEVRKTLQEMALGRPTVDAVRDLGERTGAPGLKRLTEDIVQSDRMGISIAESLRSLAHEARVQRRQIAEELARKAPIKMVPVLIFCVLPALGIVTTAPAAILLLRTFNQSAGR
jgi:tight adherence protein C